jgi:hypothetical protein
MSTRLPRAGLAPAAVLLVAWIAPAAPAGCGPAAPALVRTTYPVADLVIPPDYTPRCAVCGPAKAGQVAAEKVPAAAGPTREEELIKLITESVDPATWSCHGGRGTVDYFPLTMALVINQTPDVQDQVAELLRALRRLQDEEVAVEVRFVTVPEGFFRERLGIDFDHPGPGGPKVLNDNQLGRLIETVQADTRTSVMQAPKMTLFNGQRSVLSVGDEHNFVTGLTVTVKDDHLEYTPKTETFSSGLELCVQPLIAPDRRSVQVRLGAVFKDVDPDAPLLPVTMPVWPVGGDPQARPKAFTQYLQQPRPHKHVIRKKFTVPEGQTALLDGGTRVRESHGDPGVPVLNHVPFVKEAFGWEEDPRPETERLLVLVTPRIIVQEEEEHRPAAERKPAVMACPPAALPDAARVGVAELMKHFTAAYKEGKYQEAVLWARLAHEVDPGNPACEAACQIAARQARPAARPSPLVPCAAEEPAGPPGPARDTAARVARLVARYYQACATGQTAQARELARKALALDPACFSKNPPVVPTAP